MALTMQVGANEGDILNMFIADIHRVLGFLGDDYYARDHDFFSPNNPLTTPSSGWVTYDVNQNNPSAISELLSRADRAINYVSLSRASLGAYQNRLEFKIDNLDNSAENLQAAESRIRDTDMARKMTEFTKNNILISASIAMLSQANTIPQMVLNLLQ
jgi:flagellin